MLLKFTVKILNCLPILKAPLYLHLNLHTMVMAVRRKHLSQNSESLSYHICPNALLLLLRKYMCILENN